MSDVKEADNGEQLDPKSWGRSALPKPCALRHDGASGAQASASVGMLWQEATNKAGAAEPTQCRPVARDGRTSSPPDKPTIPQLLS